MVCGRSSEIPLRDAITSFLVHRRSVNIREQLSQQANRRHTRTTRLLLMSGLISKRRQHLSLVGCLRLRPQRKRVLAGLARSRSSLWSSGCLPGRLTEVSTSAPSRTARRQHSSATVRRSAESPASALVQKQDHRWPVRSAVDRSGWSRVGKSCEATSHTTPRRSEELLRRWRCRKPPAPSRRQFQEWLRTEQPIGRSIRKRLRQRRPERGTLPDKTPCLVFLRQESIAARSPERTPARFPESPVRQK